MSADLRCPACGAAVSMPLDTAASAPEGAPTAPTPAAAPPTGGSAPPGPGEPRDPDLRPRALESRLRAWLAGAGAQTLLAIGGVALLAVAALVFMAVAWDDLSMAARGGVLLTAAAGAGRLTAVLVGRDLRRSAEATGLLAIALLGVLGQGLWRAGMFDPLPGDAAATIVCATLMVVAALLARATGVRSTLVAAVWLAGAVTRSGGVWLLHPSRTPDAGAVLALRAVDLAAAAVVGVLAVRLLNVVPRWRVLTLASAGLLWLGAAVVTAFVLGVLHPSTAVDRPDFVLGIAVATAGTAVAIVARRIAGPPSPWWPAIGAAGAWLAGTLALSGALWQRVDGWPDLAAVASFGAGVALLSVLADRRDRAAALAGTAPVAMLATVPLGVSTQWLAAVVAERVRDPWPAIMTRMPAPDPATVALACAVSGIAVVAAVALRGTWIVVASTTAVVVAVVAAGLRIWPATGAGVVGALAVLALAVAVLRIAPPHSWTVAVAALVAPIAVALALTDPPATMATLAAVAVITATALQVPAPGRVVVIVAALCTGAVVGLVAAVVAATTTGSAPVVVALAVSGAGAWAVAAAVAPAWPVHRTGVEATGGVAFATAVVLGAAGDEAAPVAIALGVLAVAAAAIATWRGDRRWMRWVATAAATASSWTLLAHRGVQVVEAYTVPPAAAIVVLAAMGLADDRDRSSWSVLAPGLGLLIIPTLAQLVDDPRDLLRLAAVVVLGAALVLAGRAWRLQSPLVSGVVALVLAAATQLDALTDVLPRWVLLAAGGTLLLWCSVSYERQVRRAASVRRRLLTLR